MTKIEKNLEQFGKQGYVDLGSVVDVNTCADLLAKIRSEKQFSPAMFMDEESFLRSPVFNGVNPKPGFNLLDNYDDFAQAIENTDEITSLLRNLLGNGYSIIRKKIICGVPEEWIPRWILDRIRENPVNNLGPYVRPEYRDVTYFYGIDFHQDVIDFADRDIDFITLYVYLHDVSENAAPLNLLPGSFRLGVDGFPHDIDLADETSNRWRYVHGKSGQSVEAIQQVITGSAGNVALWHACTIHGTEPNIGSNERVSLRYLIAKDPDSSATFLDSVNRGITTERFNNSMRKDLMRDGAPCMKKNSLFDQHMLRKEKQ
ncbi:MAG: phytanoyl-CoA dioxygenase family protein [Gammaproteobacteria bacterium]|nr:phytanoyl-CoA dioxygenase family protein [Gammaproteobacteria bacterium]